jgi:hypothetical protein
MVLWWVSMGGRTVMVPRKAEIARAALPMFAPFGVLVQEDWMYGIAASPGTSVLVSPVCGCQHPAPIPAGAISADDFEFRCSKCRQIRAWREVRK